MSASARQPLNIDFEDVQYERPAITNLKLALLIFFTFGLIVAIFAIRYMHYYSAMPSNKFMDTRRKAIWLEGASFWQCSSSMCLDLELLGTVVQEKEKF